MQPQIPFPALTLSCVAGLALLILTSFARAQAAEDRAPEIGPDGFSQKLAAYDSAFLSGITVTGSFRSSATTKQRKEINFTCAEQKCAVKEVRILPGYKKPGEAVLPNPSVSYDPDGNMRLLSDDRMVHLFNEQKSAKIETTIEYLIAPDGKILEQKDMFNHVNYYPPDSATLVLPKVRVLWTLGRGFSSYVRKVTEVTPAEGELLRVTGEGMSMAQGPGKWVLLVDPKLGFLVREASFFGQKEKEASLIIKNFGLKTEGNCLYPEGGSFTLFLNERPVIYSVTFNSAKLEMDKDLYGSVEQVFEGPLPPRTNVHDRRVAPESYKYVNHEGKVIGQSRDEPDETAPPQRSSRLLLFLVINLAIIALVGAVMYLRGPKKRSIVARRSDQPGVP